LTDGLKILQEQFGFSMAGAITNEISGVWNLAPVYRLLRYNVSYELYFGTTSGIVPLESLQDAKPVFKRRFTDLKMDYTRMVEQGNYNMAKLIFSQMFDLLEQDASSLEQFQLWELINGMVLALGPYLDQMSQNGFDPIERLANAKNVRDFRRQCDMLFDKLISIAEKPGRGDMDSKINRAKEIIESNYADPSLSVAFIADELNITGSYLSREFKRHCGCGAQEYITNVRLDKAKCMLSTQMTIKEVALAAGFVSDVSMARVFKKHLGMTPGKYRTEMFVNWKGLKIM
jgi:AraC-like DNA-binding protein